MSDDRGRFGRWSDSLRDGTRMAKDKLAEFKAARDEAAAREREERALIDRWAEADTVNRPLIEALLPGRPVLYIGRWFVTPDHYRSDEPQDAAAKRRELGKAFDPRNFLVLLNVVNPVVWVDAIIAPIRLAAQYAMIPVDIAALLSARAVSTKDVEVPAGPGDERSTRERLTDLLKRPVIELSPEQEAFRLLFGLSPYIALEEQLAWAVENNKYIFSRNLDSIAGSVLLFVNRFTTVRLVVTDTHLHLVALESRTWLETKEGPDRREPKLLWSIERQRIVRWDTRYEEEESLHRLAFDDGSWIRINEFLGRPVHRTQLHDALAGVPGDRALRTKEAGHA